VHYTIKRNESYFFLFGFELKRKRQTLAMIINRINQMSTVLYIHESDRSWFNMISNEIISDMRKKARLIVVESRFSRHRGKRLAFAVMKLKYIYIRILYLFEDLNNNSDKWDFSLIWFLLMAVLTFLFKRLSSLSLIFILNQKERREKNRIKMFAKLIFKV
jgi:hypothetical protein